MRKILFMLLMVCLTSVNAQLIPINETELSNTVGQAFINVDRLNTATNSAGQSIDTTKITLGLDVKTSVNADLLDLGNYNRNGAGSDIRINDFALGRIDAAGKIVPFEISDPFIELAFDRTGGKENLIGLRVGFGGAKGALSGNIESLTGKINVDIVGSAAPVRAAAGSDQPGDSYLFGLNLSAPFRTTALTLAGIDNQTRLRAAAELVSVSGQSNAIRSTLVGIPNGDTLGCEADCNLGGLSNFLLGLFGSNNCAVLGIPTCFPLSSYNTLEVGNKQADGTFQKASGLYLSFLSEKIIWESGTPEAETGVFLNVPNGGLEVDFEQAFSGIERARTRYVDPYY